ncbi:MAG: nucleoside transporter C-terminal domain-containing protein [Flavobacteriales bacterium]|nr:nucleoside transporter C-terminal domain-containing protein [Flavobacteriales bacterium]
MEILRGLLGVAFLIAVCWLLSNNKKIISWKLVGSAIVLQLLFAVLILKTPGVSELFDWMSRAFLKVIDFTNEGSNFLLRSFDDGTVHPAVINFAFRILPTIVFFSALTALFYYLGILQKVVYGFAWIMKRTMRISGPESLSTAANIFLGQTEAPLVVKPYIAKMTRSELLCIMIGGMATVAGGVLAVYINFLGGTDKALQLAFTKHLITASFMAAPATILVSKMLLPETEKFSEDMNVNKEKLGTNVLEAIATGTTDGVKLAVNVGAMLLVFIAFIALLNFGLGKAGEIGGLNAWIVDHTNYAGLSFQFILGYALAPVAWLLGVNAQDMVLIGQVLGEKTIVNELVAYGSLGDMTKAGLISDPRSAIIATYALCGFANFASIGIQIGGISTMAPEKKSMLAQLGIKALIGGTIASFMTAAIVGMFM